MPQSNMDDERSIFKTVGKKTKNELSTDKMDGETISNSEDYEDMKEMGPAPEFDEEFVKGERVDEISSSDNTEDVTSKLLNDTHANNATKIVNDSGFHNTKMNLKFLAKRVSSGHLDGEGILRIFRDHNVKKSEDIPLNEKDDGENEMIVNTAKVVSNNQVLSTGGPNVENEAKKSPSKKCSVCGPAVQISIGLVCIAIGIATTLWTPYEFLMSERLRMTPGLPPFEWWARPPDSVILKINLFNVTNAERYLNGLDEKIHMQEIGPITYLEKLVQSNITFNENSTLSYTAKRWVEFLPEENRHIDMNATICVPNLPVLGFIAYVNEKAPFFKLAFKLMLWNLDSQPFRNMTIYDYLWNFTDPVLTAGKTYLPGIVPITNVGMLQTMYLEFTDRVTVFIGTRWGDRKFFTLNNFQGRETLPGYGTPGSTCRETVKGSTEGLIYSQRLQRNSTLLYWRKSLCKVIKLNYLEDQEYDGVQAMRFKMPTSIYNRTHDPENPDCFASEPELANGLSDISKCFFNFPMALSLPHFHLTDTSVSSKIDGMKPDPELHESYAIVEPISGIPLESRARSQNNLIIGDLSGFSPIFKRFSNLAIPIFWAEYSQRPLPGYIWAMIIAIAKVLPIAQAVLSAILILAGLLLVYKFCKVQCYQKSFKKQRQLNNLAKNAIFNYEHEKKHVSNSLKRPSKY